MHIVFGIERYWPASGGAEAYVRSIAKELSTRHRITVISLVRDDAPMTPIRRSLKLPNLSVTSDEQVNIKPLSIGIRERLLLAPILIEMLPHRSHNTYTRMRAFVLRHFARVVLPNFIEALGEADLIHTVAPWEMSYLAQLASAKLGIPHVVTGLMHPGYWADDSQSVALFKHCDVVIALLKAERDAYLRAGIPPQVIKVVGVPAPFTTYADKSLFHQKYPTQGSIILFLGVKRWYKGCDILLESAPYVWHKFPDASFVFLGPRSNESRNLFSQVVDPRVIEDDKVSDELKNSALAACNIVCLPSATEIMPNVILEAWMAGKPVITSDIPALAELVTVGGLTTTRTPTALADAIIRMLENPGLAERMGIEGRKKAMQDFSALRITSALEDIYFEVSGKEATI
jgi:glycosyltransferase involved in cell wall biosynthesis